MRHILYQIIIWICDFLRELIDSVEIECCNCDTITKYHIDETKLEPFICRKCKKESDFILHVGLSYKVIQNENNTDL